MKKVISLVVLSFLLLIPVSQAFNGFFDRGYIKSYRQGTLDGEPIKYVSGKYYMKCWYPYGDDEQICNGYVIATIRTSNSYLSFKGLIRASDVDIENEKITIDFRYLSRYEYSKYRIWGKSMVRNTLETVVLDLGEQTMYSEGYPAFSTAI